MHVLICSVHGENGLRWPQIGPGGFFPTNPDLADILGRTDLNFDNFYVFSFFGPQISGFPGPKNLDFPTSQNLNFPASKKSTRRPGGGRAVEKA